MKLGYILKAFPRVSETFILTELLGLERLGGGVTIFSRYNPAEDVPHAALNDLKAEVIHLETLLKDRFWEPFEIHRRLARRFGEPHDRALETAIAYRSRQELRYWMLAGSVAEKAADLGLDHLHAHFATGSASVARYASRITGIPFSFTAHAKDIYLSTVDPRRLSDLLLEASSVITVSDANLAYLRSLAPEARVVRIYNGLDLDRFPFLTAPPSSEPAIILSVARFVEKKGLSDLIAAVARLRSRGKAVRCRLVGTGPLEEALRSQVRDLGLDGQVEFKGMASQEEVTSTYLPQASSFVLPCVVASDGDRDGLPATLVEAMARGIPVISTTLPGIPEAIPDGEAGLLAEPGDVDGLADAIARTLENRDATIKRATTARKRVEELFDSRKNVESLLATLQDATREQLGAGTHS